MSKRPTSISRKNNSNAQINTTNFGYAIIGDTATSTLYAKRLLGNNITQPISVISEGIDRSNIDDISDINFAANNNKRILHYIRPEQIHMIPAGDNNEDPDGNLDNQEEQTIYYYVGAGPLGDFISAYIIPRTGPWFGHSSSGRLERFLNQYTVRSPLTSEEIIISDRISQIWGIPKTSSMVVKGPSILNQHYEFLQLHDDMVTREIFLDEYHMVNSTSNVDYITQASNIRFTSTNTNNCLYNITANNFSLSSVRPIWKTNPYTYLRLATEGGLNPEPLLLPTFYRGVLSIPISGTGDIGITGISGCTAVAGITGFVCFSCTGTTTATTTCECFNTVSGTPNLSQLNTCYVGLSNISGVDFTGVVSTEDLITSHVSFSLYDIANPQSSALAWLVQVYTTTEDLSVVTPEGKYADSGRQLLIIEALSTKNKRRASYNISEREIQINYNDRIAEEGYLNQFAHIVAGVYNAYTGLLIPVDSLITESSVCSANSGTCHDANIITDYSLRQSPMVSVLELASHLYGSEIYPTPNPKC